MEISKRLENHILNILTLVIIFAIILSILTCVNGNNIAQMLNSRGKFAVGEIRRVEINPRGNGRIKYWFSVKDKLGSSFMPYRGFTGQLRGVNVGEKYLVVYLEENPRINTMVYSYPMKEYDLNTDLNSIIKREDLNLNISSSNFIMEY